MLATDLRQGRQQDSIQEIVGAEVSHALSWRTAKTSLVGVSKCYPGSGALQCLLWLFQVGLGSV